ncbi:MAG: hypothetical protein BAJALOKI1v1_360008 [Promethearchaeota archaeon]|nr:MAG: hypothetical protein BAJALOKI1v1_360008 [Candidatus Lokiarchaeota archaeon]
MTDLKLEVTYFEKSGPENLDKAMAIAKHFADELQVKDIILASTTGTTAKKALDLFDPDMYNVVVIAHSYYFVNSKVRQEFDEDLLKELQQKGLKIHLGTHSMSGIERGLRIKKEPWIFVDLVARLLRKQFSDGIKVCIEIASMAVDAGLIPDLDRDVICIGGSGRGADTVCLIKPAPTSEFDKLRVKAILCKPL